MAVWQYVSDILSTAVVWLYGCMAVWQYGCVAVCQWHTVHCSCVAVWLYGHTPTYALSCCASIEFPKKNNNDNKY